ncbi:MAG: hypothetical protein ACKV19_08405 [Verrucomicrobiales bacterium]
MLSVAAALLAVWVVSLWSENRRLRAADAAEESRGPADPSARLPPGVFGAANRPASPGPPDAPEPEAAPPARQADSAQAAIPSGPLGIRNQPDGTLALTAGDGTVLAALTSEAARDLAQSIDAALLDATATQPGGPSWSPGQVAGAPDTEGHGDFRTAWASQDPDGGSEWLQVGFERAVEVSEIVIHETFNPGALAKVSALLPDGSYKTLWEGTTPAEGESVERALPLPPGITSDQIRIELDTQRVPGWNEIDAVQLVGTDGSRQWAEKATASSFYGQNRSSWSLISREFQDQLQQLWLGPESPVLTSE